MYVKGIRDKVVYEQIFKKGRDKMRLDNRSRFFGFRRDGWTWVRSKMVDGGRVIKDGPDRGLVEQ